MLSSGKDEEGIGILTSSGVLVQDSLGIGICKSNTDGIRPQHRLFLKGTMELQSTGHILDLPKKKKNFMEERHDLLKNVMGNTHAVITMNAVEQSHQEFEPDIIISDEASFFCDPEIQYATTTLQPADQILLVRDYKQLWPLAFTNEGQRI